MIHSCCEAWEELGKGNRCELQASLSGDSGQVQAGGGKTSQEERLPCLAAIDPVQRNPKLQLLNQNASSGWSKKLYFNFDQCFQIEKKAPKESPVNLKVKYQKTFLTAPEDLTVLINEGEPEMIR